MALVGPLAVVLGLGSAFAALGTNVLAVLDTDAIRIPLMVLAILGAGANLYTVWHGHRLRERAAAEDRFVALTRLESRRAFVVVALACLTVGLGTLVWEKWRAGGLVLHAMYDRDSMTPRALTVGPG